MFRLLATVVLLGGLAIGGTALWRDAGLREQLWARAGAWLDETLGIQGGPRNERPKATPAPRIAKPQQDDAPARAPVVTIAPKAPYVDRSPVPSAVERVREEDRRRLDDIIARRGGAAR